MEHSTQIALFKGREIRKTLHNHEWWFSVEDVVFALTDSSDPKQYISKLRRRDEELAKGWVQIVHTLRLETAGGPQKVNCANTEGLFRLIQSIPSPKAEPFKRWLAKVGYERIQEIENPELAAKRARAIYQAKGYPEDWIEKRVRSIAIREIDGRVEAPGGSGGTGFCYPDSGNFKGNLWNYPFRVQKHQRPQT